MPVIRRRQMLRLGAAVLFVSPATSRARAETGATLEVWKNRGCACCTAWAEPFRAAGFTVTLYEVDDLTATRAAAGVPADLAGCHTAKIVGYVVEGHVPLEDVQRLLAERPTVLGLAVPGMPMGSPGMEVPGTTAEAFQVVAFGPNGSRYVFREVPAG